LKYLNILTNFPDFRYANISIKSEDSISVLWRPRGNHPGRSPLNPTLTSRVDVEIYWYIKITIKYNLEKKSEEVKSRFNW
jgi:hypothetical protein